MTELNPYKVLGVDRDADEKQVRAAYRKVSKRAHPDAEGGSPEFFAKVTTSLAVLTDPRKRKTYDDTGRVEEDKPDIDGAAALGIVQQQIAAIVNDYIGSNFSAMKDPRRMDIPKVIAGRIQREIRQGNDALKVGQKVIETLKDIARRFSKRKADNETIGSDPVARGFKDQIDQNEQQIAALQQSIRYHEFALQIAETYDFEMENPKPEPESRSFDLYAPGSGSPFDARDGSVWRR